MGVCEGEREEVVVRAAGERGQRIHTQREREKGNMARRILNGRGKVNQTQYGERGGREEKEREENEPYMEADSRERQGGAGERKTATEREKRNTEETSKEVRK